MLVVSTTQRLSVQGLLSCLEERNKDPVIGSVVRILAKKIPVEWSTCVEAEKKRRTLVSSGIKEPEGDLPPSQQQLDVEGKVTTILDALNVQCRPTREFCIAFFNPCEFTQYVNERTFADSTPDLILCPRTIVEQVSALLLRFLFFS
ncbi:hypothetical protein OESDEN_12436 [Oesophagostomum dentatum]|uniref:Uncharacterized protein n=1 Tax=Oesophagostomum dentatum TaxID=61180 RepID=A0A0B1SV61_OESDE|nr:hypothetical protein OESDEN_12436 [Oesophagostomum dentatum]